MTPAAAPLRADPRRPVRRQPRPRAGSGRGCPPPAPRRTRSPGIHGCVGGTRWWRTAKAVMKAASDGPTRLRSVNSKSLAVSLEREHADAGTGRCLAAARAPHHSGAAHSRSGCRNRCAPGRGRMAAVTALAVPHLERCAALAADHRPVVLVTFRLSGAYRHIPLLRAACRACDRSGLAVLVRVVMPMAGAATAPVEVPDAGPKGPSDDGGRDELVESRASFSACSIASACRRHSNSTRASGLSASKKRRSMPERSTGPLRVMPPINQNRPDNATLISPGQFLGLHRQGRGGERVRRDFLRGVLLGWAGFLLLAKSMVIPAGRRSGRDGSSS